MNRERERVGGEKLWTNLKQFSFLGQLELGAETRVKVSLVLVYGLSKKRTINYSNWS